MTSSASASNGTASSRRRHFIWRTGDEFFRSLANNAALALGARYAFASETLSELESRSLAYWEGSGFGEGFSYRFPAPPANA